MKSLAGTKTEQNLLKAFAGESQARNRYGFYAKVADKEGFKQISAIFEETSEHERSHAKRFFDFLEGRPVEITAIYTAGKIKTTVENLHAAAEGEYEEHTSLYPGFAQTAKEEGFAEIAAVFKIIAKVEIEHERRFRKLLKNMEEGKLFKKDEVKKWKCRKCGFVHEGKEAPEKCPACLHPQGYFEIQDENY
jgi:rubrerythrin